MGTFKVVIIVQMDLYWFFEEYYITLLNDAVAKERSTLRVVHKHQLLRFLAVTFISVSRGNFHLESQNVSKQTNKKKHKNNITLKPSR